MDYVRDVSGNGYENVGIGTDLDGFTHVPDNLCHCSKLTLLSRMIVDHCGETVAAKVLHDNAIRVFKECCC
jgi:microsomal dipeptidase-like Zn-dependent dipeptidase